MSKSSRPLLRADRTAGDGQRDDHRQQVKRGVNAHVPVAAVPVEPLIDGRAHGRKPAGLGRDQDDRPALCLHRRGDGDAPARPVQRAAVARLPAAARVEDRLVEDDAALVGMPTTWPGADLR
jgi:hypothetical protein